MPQMNPIRLLLIEDDPNDVFLFKEMLSESRTFFEIEIADCMAMALHRLKDGGIDCVLCDLSLPDSHGMDTFASIHACAPQMPVIILSGDDDENHAMKMVEKGAQDYLVKGQFDCRLLVRAIRYALKREESDKALAEERNLLRSVIDAQPDSIYVKDAQGRYMLDNTAHMKRLGATSMEQVSGKTAYDFFPPKIAEKFHQDDDQVMKEGKSIVNFQESTVDAAGKKYWLSTTKVPLRNRAGEIVGLVGVGRDITERKRAEEKIALYNEELRAKNGQLEDDMRMASEVQQAFLPQQETGLLCKAAKNTLHFYSSYIPTGAVGGDFFHVLPLSDTTAGVFISDVMGHGVRAALVTALQRALVEELAGVASDPGEFLTQINRALLSILRRTGTPLFVSAFYMFVDVTNCEIRYAAAGHPKPLLLRRSEGLVKMLATDGSKPGPALGIFGEQKYETTGMRLDPGDLVLLFTDGLFEVEGPEGELFDEEKLADVVREKMKLPPEELSNAIFDEVRKFSSTGEFIDDVCLLIMDFEGTSGDEGML